MTKKEFWLRLFDENDTALACAIHLCERFVTEESLNHSKDFILKERTELYQDVPEAMVAELHNFKGAVHDA